MAGARTYYCICEDNCKYETLNREEIIAAIAEATGNVPTGVDDAFITKLKEGNANSNVELWVGTQAQFNALSPAPSWAAFSLRRNTSTGKWYAITDVNPIEDKADKVGNATAGNFAGLNASGNLVDSGFSGVDIQTLGNVIGFGGWNQLVKNGDFSGGVSGWIVRAGTVTATGGELQIVATAETKTTNQIYQSADIVSGHKYLVTFDAKMEAMTGSNLDRARTVLEDGTTSRGAWSWAISNEYEHKSRIITAAGDGDNIKFGMYGFSGAVTIGDKIYFKNIKCHDLTAIYGAGNEPTSEDEFKRTFPEDYYPASDHGFDLLWKCADESATQAGFSVTVAPFEPYKFAAVVFKNWASESGRDYHTFLVPVGASTWCSATYVGKILSRNVAVSSSDISGSIVFGDGQIFNSYGSPTTDNDRMVPCRVYGVR